MKRGNNFETTIEYLTKLKTASKIYDKIFTAAGERGVAALKAVTPVDTGLTRDSWKYSYEIKNSTASLIFSNNNLAEEGTPIVILLVYGHATQSGYYVQGNDFVTPAIKPILEQLANDIWLEVTKV